jgi:hypothetical protein
MQEVMSDYLEALNRFTEITFSNLKKKKERSEAHLTLLLGKTAESEEKINN